MGEADSSELLRYVCMTIRQLLEGLLIIRRMTSIFTSESFQPIYNGNRHDRLKYGRIRKAITRPEWEITTVFRVHRKVVIRALPVSEILAGSNHRIPTPFLWFPDDLVVLDEDWEVTKIGTPPVIPSTI